MGCDPAAKLFHAFLADVLRAALHSTGIADLRVAPVWCWGSAANQSCSSTHRRSTGYLDAQSPFV
jgi:hypothetical protein